MFSQSVSFCCIVISDLKLFEYYSSSICRSTSQTVWSEAIRGFTPRTCAQRWLVIWMLRRQTKASTTFENDDNPSKTSFEKIRKTSYDYFGPASFIFQGFILHFEKPQPKNYYLIVRCFDDQKLIR